MAQLLLGKDWAERDSLGLYLQGFLSNEYVIVANVAVNGCTADAVVVGPQGLFVLYVAESDGTIRRVYHPPSWQRFVPGRKLDQVSPEREARRVTDVLQRFLRSEFPGLRPSVHHLLVLNSPQAAPVPSHAGEPIPVGKDEAAETIELLEMQPAWEPWDADTRQAVARALRDGGLTRSRRATEPFVFRSGGLFGSGKKVWTILAAVEHMDRYPEDGYFHLRNGTIARWFTEQGAQPLADLAREILRAPETDSRAVLESFLYQSGLVRRSPLSVRPGKVNLGYVLSGGIASAPFRLRKGRGRGYPFGTLQASEPWLRVDPRTFSGLSVGAMVTADTTELPVARKPWQAHILVESRAAREPLQVPVQVRVAGMPSPLDRYLLRPLLGLTYAGMLGACLGWFLGFWAIPEPGWFESLASFPLSWIGAWTAAIGLFWAILGGIRGALQPLAWPTSYALSRWFLRTLVWAVVFSLLAVAGYWALGQLNAEVGAAPLPFSLRSLVLIAWSLATVPALLGDLQSPPDSGQEAAPARGRMLLRPALVGVIGVSLALVLVVGVQALGPAWQDADVDGTMSTVEEWLDEQFTSLETGLDGAIHQFYLRYYDRRAPAQATAVPASVPTKGIAP